MFALPADLSLRLAHQRMADDRDKAARHQRAQAARHGAASPEHLDAPAPRHRLDQAPAGHLTVRTTDPTHRDALVTFLRSLSPRTAYRRFFTDMPRPTALELDRMLRIDARHRAVLAMSDDTIVGHAMAVPGAQDDAIEIAVVIGDAWQGHGLGPRLVHDLLTADPAATAPEIAFDVLSDNRPALRLIRRLWPGANITRDGNVVRYRISPTRRDIQDSALPGQRITDPVPAGPPTADLDAAHQLTAASTQAEGCRG